MTKATALITAFAFTFALPASQATASPANLLMEEHRSEAGYQVDLYVTEGPDGVLSEATLTLPETEETVDVWTDGTTVWWDGVVDGSHVNGSMLVTDFDRGPQAFCAGPVAIVCIGVVIVAIALGTTCKTSDEACGGSHGTEVPGGAGGVPEPGGDGDGDGDSGQGGAGGDED